MCGILGSFAIGGKTADRERFKRSLLVMRHRGPDDMGLYEAPGIILGHVRLAIIDLKTGHQPWVDAESGVAITYNGELYNYIEERAILESKGHRFHSLSDTEVLVRMYLEYGVNMLGRMNGMFAFAIYDSAKRYLFCARDHIGIKPFYYQKRAGEFTFASEIKSLVALGGDFELEPTALADYINLQFVMEEKTFFKNIFRLMPGEFIKVFPDGAINKETYWSIDPTDEFQGSHEQASDKLRQLLERSIFLQLRADVPIGAHLSGGLDTGCIAALAAKRLSPARLCTFTAAFGEGGIFDDSEAAEINARFADTDHHVIFPTFKDFENFYPKLAWHMDEPMAGEGVFPQFMVSRLAREKVSVVLGGQGADEILAGYTRYYIFLLDQAIRHDMDPGRNDLGIDRENLEKGREQLSNYAPLWSKIQSGGASDDPELHYWRLIDRSELLREFLSEDFIASLQGYNPYDAYRERFNRFPKAALLNKVLYFESSCWLPALLHVEDRMSMAASIESRVPFLDPDLIRFSFSLPPRIKMRNGKTKAAIRDAFAANISPEIRDRKIKLGFPVPTNQWFSGSLKDFVRDILGSESCLNRGIFKRAAFENVKNHRLGGLDRSMWGMLNIELWHQNLQAADSGGDRAIPCKK